MASIEQGPRFLLLQVRNPGDPMSGHEIECFERCFDLASGQVEIFDLLSGAPSASQIDAVDVVLLGGSGDYSVARAGVFRPWHGLWVVRSSLIVHGPRSVSRGWNSRTLG